MTRVTEELRDLKYYDALLGKILRQRTTYQPINVKPFMDSLSIKSPTTTERQSMEKDFSSQLRMTLKVTEYTRRSLPNKGGYGLWLCARCAVCRRPLSEGTEMHEAFITRGDVQGLPWESRVQIYCSQNIALVHPKCHTLAQWTTRGKRIVARNILRWNGDDSVRHFLWQMYNVYFSSAAQEAARRLQTWNLLQWD